MPDVDLAAIRADYDLATAYRPSATQAQHDAAGYAYARLVDDHLPALLALVDEQAAAMAKIDDDIASSNDDLCRSRDLLGKTQAMVERGYDRAVAERDELATAVGRRDARITRLQLALISARRDADCYRADHRDRHGLPSDPRHAGCRAAEEADCAVAGCDGERVELHVAQHADPVAVLLDCGHEAPKPLKAPVSLQNAPADPGTRDTPLAPA